MHPVGKRLRKKEKLGFIESEPAPARPGDRQMLYGLHPVSLALSAGLRQMAGGTGVHQGVCARVTPLLPRPVDELLVRTGYPPLGTPPPPTAAAGEQEPDGGPTSGSADDTVEAERPGRRRRLWLMLDRVQDPMNFGSIIRSSYFLGVDAIIIPDKNSCPLSPTVSKASAGALEVFPVYSAPAASCRQLLQLLASRQWQLVVADTETGGNNTQRAPPIVAGTDTILVVAQRDLVHGVESLNVGVATGILLSQLVLAR
ncbi:rRNA methyltransferase 1, mitochondrial [Amphibalanus amphitrite]|uniref:rRNA methyltransferase 1, mitochondrial n=1 Tax=Amphibalanus amphitrite TaxID=1232801 RepID=A0A6A4XEQ4_AMPAM|nr:rRNA methyltransferase 1, mitochondrial [Amphibalanus amphitrite]